MLKASIAKAPFLIDFEKSLRFSLISFENVRKISSILLDFFLNCPRILQNFSSNPLNFEFQNAVGTLILYHLKTPENHWPEWVNLLVCNISTALSMRLINALIIDYNCAFIDYNTI